MRVLSPDFAGNERFRILRRLGAGGMGVVYEAHDHERGTRVALKTIRHVDAGAILRFKREFRALADLTHPNLVSLYELFSDGNQWFFTLELIDGVTLLQALRPGTETPAEQEVGADETLPSGSTPAPKPATAPLDWDRVRHLFRQIASAVHAVHRAGWLHRDLKPSNAMVTRDDRVVLLDFGLATGLGDPSRTDEQNVVGTAAYMAPEQAAMAPLTPAADWYALGAILYEVLTGRVPFKGAPVQALLAKQQREPPPPIEVAPGIPEDLNRLCIELLRTHPKDRPSGEEVVTRLEGATPVKKPLTPSTGSFEFVGREQQLLALEALVERARAGEAAVALVHGPSGVGKSALMRRFAARLPENALHLNGRCYERESVPFKALDTVIDALTAHLCRMDRGLAAAVMPRDIAALARLFPVLLRVPAFGAAPTAPGRATDSTDLHVIRRRAFAAARELFARLADRTQVIITIDDLQWGDADSAALLAELLRPPEAPAVLLVAAMRDEEVQALAAVRELVADRGIEVTDLSLGPLSEEESRTFARQLLGERDESRVAALVRESNGSPFFLDVLGRYGGKDASSLEEVLASKLRELPPAPAALLQTIAVAGGPVPWPVAFAAARIPEAEVEAAQARLRADRLIRTSGGARAALVETYHDRIRHAVMRALSAEEKRRLHLALARAYEQQGGGGAELLAQHLEAGGEPERAQRFIVEAADRAFQALAFDRAAALYRRAVESGPRERALTVRLGQALANSGRGREAADAFLAAVALMEPGARAIDRYELQRLAAEQLLRCGHVDEGLEVLARVFEKLGLKLDNSPRAAVWRLLRRRFFLALRGLGAQLRTEEQLAPEALARIDTCWSVAIGLGMVDTIRGATFQTKHLRLALDAGEPYRLCRAFAAEAAYRATGGLSQEKRALALIARARALSEEVKSTHVDGLVQLASGFVAFMVGRWRGAREDADRALHLFEDAGVGFTWEAKNAHLFALWSLFYLGEFGELSRRLPGLQREAKERGDRYAETSLRCGLAVVANLAADRVDLARSETELALATWSHQEFHFQHYWGLLASSFCDLYEGRPRVAYDRVRDAWKALGRSQLLRIQNVRIEGGFLRAQCAVAASAGAPDADALRQSAEDDARALEKERSRWSSALAKLVRAGLLVATDRAAAAEAFGRAEEACRRADMAHYAYAARRRRGALTDPALVAEADAWFAAQGIRRPERMVAFLAAVAVTDVR